jgi:hypothetical protein
MNASYELRLFCTKMGMVKNEGYKHFMRDIRELLCSDLAKGLSILSDRSRSSRQDRPNLEDLHESIVSPIG